MPVDGQRSEMNAHGKPRRKPRTGDQIARQPDQIVPAAPAQEGKQADEIEGDLAAVGRDLAQPVDGAGLLLEVRVGGRDGEDGLAARRLVVGRRTAVVIDLDGQRLGQAVADLGGARGRHDGGKMKHD